MSRPRAKPRTDDLLATLRQLYPDAEVALTHRSAFELTVATILSAQCTDERVNKVTPSLFGRYPDAAALAVAEQAELEAIIRSTGFFRNKAKNLIGMARALTENFGGQVPRTMEELLTLPGVARKTANVVMGSAFGIISGVVVDTHVTRLSGLLGLSRESDPVRIEQDLMALFPREAWIELSHLLIWHGRRVCIARRPKCAECALSQLCPSAFPTDASRRRKRG
jgi:endonuclease III